ncbi:MAG: hypothetical protein WBW56_02035, partial [Syntrophobacteraceae bacterium]
GQSWSGVSQGCTRHGGLTEGGDRNQKGHEGTLTAFGFALALPARVKRWTLTAFRSGLDVSNMVRCFKSGHDLL